MEMLYYTIAAVVLYLVSDFILNTIEIKMGKRLPARSVIFLIIITLLALASFTFLRAIFGPLQNTPQKTPTQIEQSNNKPASTQVLPEQKKK